MARPIKEGLDYFPLDVALDDKFDLIEAEFGFTGFAVVVKLFQRIYGGRGYYCEWTDEVAMLFAKKIGAGGSVVSEIIKASLKRGIFDFDMFEKYGILTSVGIQKRYVEAKRKDFSKIKREYLLLSVPKTEVNATKTEVNATKTEVNAAKSTQRKGEKNKVKESKGEKGNAASASPSLDDVRDYCNEKGYSNYDYVKFFNYYEANGWKVRGNPIVNWRAKLDSWYREDMGKEKLHKTTLQPPKGVFNNYNQKVYTAEEIDEILRRKNNE